MLNPDGKSENNISLFEAMYTARAMRWLKPDPIPAVIIEQILEAAIQAPNAGNRQNWLFMVVRDPEQRRRIGEIYLRVSSWVLQRYQHQSKPAYQSAEEYEHMMQGGLHLYEHMGDAPVLLIPCLRVTVLELPAEIPPEVRTAMREAAPWSEYLSCGTKHNPGVSRTRAWNCPHYQSHDCRRRDQGSSEPSTGI
jgi:nitroreductase